MNTLQIFFRKESENTEETVFWNTDDNEPMGTGYYYWFCFPGCMPESEPIGPFETYEEALKYVEETEGE